MRTLFSAIVATLVVAPHVAEAATVDAASTVNFVFEFDRNDDAELFQFTYSAELGAPDGAATSIEPGGSFGMDFGTSLSDDSIGSYVFTNPFNFPIEGVGSVFQDPIILPGGASAIFVSINYIDDVFDIGQFELHYFDENSERVILVGQVIAPVPLPAPFALLLGSLVMLRAVSKSKN